MKSVNEKQLRDLVSTGNIDFIGTAYTPWHAIGDDAIIEYLKRSNPAIKGLCLVCKHPDSGFCINEQHFKNTCSQIYKYEIDSGISIKDIWLLINYLFNDSKPREFSRPLYFISYQPLTFLASFCYYRLKNVHAIFINRDEGVGGYMNTVVREKESFHFSFKCIKNLIGYFLKQTLAVDYIKRTHDVLDMGIFRKTEKGLLENEIIFPYYKKRFTIDSNKINLNLPINKNQPTALICTTAWRRELIKEEEDLQVLKRVTKHFQESGFNLILKTHPRDSFWETKAFELSALCIKDKSVSTEVLHNIIRPNVIVSYSSTVLITAKLFWNIPAWCITDMLNRGSLDSLYIKEIDSFKHTFHNQVQFINSVDILRVNIDNLKRCQ